MEESMAGYFLWDLGDEVKRLAREAARDKKRRRGSEVERAFADGRAFAWYEIASLMHQQAETFQLPLVALRFDDFVPEELL